MRQLGYRVADRLREDVQIHSFSNTCFRIFNLKHPNTFSIAAGSLKDRHRPRSPHPLSNLARQQVRGDPEQKRRKLGCRFVPSRRAEKPYEHLLCEIFRLRRAEMPPDLDLVVNAYRSIREKSYHELEAEFVRVVSRLARRTRS